MQFEQPNGVLNYCNFEKKTLNIYLPAFMSFVSVPIIILERFTNPCFKEDLCISSVLNILWLYAMPAIVS